jgi:hypothetical protein
MLRTVGVEKPFTRRGESGLGHRGVPREPSATAIGTRATPVDAIIAEEGFGRPK